MPAALIYDIQIPLHPEGEPMTKIQTNKVIEGMINKAVTNSVKAVRAKELLEPLATNTPEAIKQRIQAISEVLKDRSIDARLWVALNDYAAKLSIQARQTSTKTGPGKSLTWGKGLK